MTFAQKLSRLLRAGVIATLVLAALATAALTWFGDAYAGYDTGAFFTRLFFWSGVTLLSAAPICLVVFPLMHLVLGGGEPVRPRNFAIVGALLGFAIAFWLVWRFRSTLLQASFLAMPLFVLIGTLAGLIGGFVYEWLARERLSA